MNKLTLLLGITFILTAISAFFSFQNTKDRLIHGLENRAYLQASLINQRFQTAEREALLLSQIYEKHPLNPKNFSESLMKEHTCNRRPRSTSDYNISQIYRMIDQKSYLFSFNVQLGKEITLFTPKMLSDEQLIKRKNELLDLFSHPRKDNIFWGKPVYSKNEGWHISLALCNQHGGFSGIALNMSVFFLMIP